MKKSMLKLTDTRFELKSLTDFESFCKTLSESKMLKRLKVDLQIGEINNRQAAGLAEALGKCNSLESINLNPSKFKMGIGSEKYRNFFMVLDKCTSLKHLAFSSIDLKEMNHNDYDFKSFCKKIEKCTSLRTLELFNNKLYEMELEQLAILGDALQNCTSLQTLNFGLNALHSMKPEQLEALGDMLHKCTSLQTLSLVGNALHNMTPEKIAALGDMLHKCTSLKTLNLTGNEFFKMSHEQLTTLAVALEQCPASIHGFIDSAFGIDPLHLVESEKLAPLVGLVMQHQGKDTAYIERLIKHLIKMHDKLKNRTQDSTRIDQVIAQIDILTHHIASYASVAKSSMQIPGYESIELPKIAQPHVRWLIENYWDKATECVSLLNPEQEATNRPRMKQ